MGTTNQKTPTNSFATAVLDTPSIARLYRQDDEGGDSVNDVFLTYLEGGRVIEDPDETRLLVMDPAGESSDHVVARLHLAIRQRQHRRRTRRHNDAARLDVHLQGVARAAEQDETAEHIDATYAARLLHEALGDLAELQRCCVVEFHLTGDSYDQIAQRHDITNEHARQLARRGRAALARQLSHKSFFADWSNR